MKKKIVTIALVVALLAIAVAGTLAFFTDDDTATNTFTFGKVDIELDETSTADTTNGYLAGSVNTSGTGFDFDNVLPGLKYAKKPVITVKVDSMDAYVFAELVVEGYNELYKALAEAGLSADDFSKLLVGANLGTGTVVDHWMVDGEDIFHIVYTNGVMEAEGTWTLFEAIQVPEQFTSKIMEDANLEEVSLTINAYAVQADGITDAAAAWAVVDPA